MGYRNTWRPILPVELAKSVAKAYHESTLGAHIGARKLLTVLSRKFIIPRGGNAVKQVIQGCQLCLQRKRPQQNLGLMASKPPCRPWHTVAMDFCGPYIESDEGHKYVLVFVDHFTKWVELVPTRDQLASTVFNSFYRFIICRHGCPERLLSDNGPQFRSQLVQGLCKEFDIQKIYSSAYYPQGDGYAERFMRTLNNSLAALSSKDPRHWSAYVPGLMFAYNASEHEATQLCPFEMCTGRLPRLPGEWCPSSHMNASDSRVFVKQLRNTISMHCKRSTELLQRYWEKQKQNFDKRRRDIHLDIGTSVLVKLTEAERAQYPCRKLAPRWSAPMKVTSCLSNGVTYNVDDDKGRTKVVHVSRMLPLPAEAWGHTFGLTRSEIAAKSTGVESEDCDDDYMGEAPITVTCKMSNTGRASGPEPERSVRVRQCSPDIVESWTSETPVPHAAESSRVESTRNDRHWLQEPLPPHQAVYDVHKIHSHNYVHGKKMLLVEWKHFPDRSDWTWEPRKNLIQDVKHIVRNYERQVRWRS